LADKRNDLLVDID